MVRLTSHMSYNQVRGYIGGANIEKINYYLTSVKFMCETLDEIHAAQIANIIAKMRKESQLKKQISAIAWK